MMSVMWRKFPLTEVIMPSNKKPLWGPGPPASQAPPSSAEDGKSSRRQPCCCCQWHLSATFRSVWCTWTLRKSDYPWEPRNSPRAIPLSGHCPKGATRHLQMPGRSWWAGKAMRRWKARRSWCAPLKMGLAGLTSRHQTTGRVRVFATANTWRTQRPHGVSGFGTESQWRTLVRGIEISALCGCSASLTSVSLHGCLAFCGVRLSCLPPWNLITVKSWL